MSALTCTLAAANGSRSICSLSLTREAVRADVHLDEARSSPRPLRGSIFFSYVVTKDRRISWSYAGKSEVGIDVIGQSSCNLKAPCAAAERHCEDEPEKQWSARLEEAL